MKKIEITSALLGDVALPLAGFLFWDWGFYFIALFFLFDLLFRTIFLKKRLTQLNELRGRNRILLKGFLFSFFEVVLIHCIVISTFSTINIGDSFMDFLTYKDMGIQQGIVLLPLLLFSELMKIRNENKMGVPHVVRSQIIINSQNVQRYRIVLWIVVYLFVLFLPVNELALIIVFFLFFIAQPFLVFRNIK